MAKTTQPSLLSRRCQRLSKDLEFLHQCAKSYDEITDLLEVYAAIERTLGGRKIIKQAQQMRASGIGTSKRSTGIIARGPRKRRNVRILFLSSGKPKGVK